MSMTAKNYTIRAAMGAPVRHELSPRETDLIREWVRIEDSGRMPTTAAVALAMRVNMATACEHRNSCAERGALVAIGKGQNRKFVATEYGRSIAHAVESGALPPRKPDRNIVRVRPSHVCAVLRTSADNDGSPEAALWLAVLCAAVRDLHGRDGTARRSAQAFFYDDGHASWLADVCGFAGLEPVYVKELLKKIGARVEFARDGQVIHHDGDELDE